MHFLWCFTKVATPFCELKVGTSLWYCLQRMRHLMLLFQSRFFQSAMLIPSAAFDICSEKILGDRKVWLWVSETDTTVLLVTEKCKGSYLAVYGLLSCNNSLLTETQFSVDPSSPSADVSFFNPVFFSLFSSLPAFFLPSECNHRCKILWHS